MTRRGFTLLELLTAVSIMALLGVAASSGYNSLIRGMKERGAVAAASAVLRSARERAAVDQSPTVVFCYNRCMREAGGPAEVSAVVCGEMEVEASMERTDNSFVKEVFYGVRCID